MFNITFARLSNCLKGMSRNKTHEVVKKSKYWYLSEIHYWLWYHTKTVSFVPFFLPKERNVSTINIILRLFPAFFTIPFDSLLLYFCLPYFSSSFVFLFFFKHWSTIKLQTEKAMGNKSHKIFLKEQLLQK